MNDFLCHSTDGKLQLFNVRTAQILPLQQQFCNAGNVKVMTSDINGDFKHDLLCLNKDDGKLNYLLNGITGGFFQGNY